MSKIRFSSKHPGLADVPRDVLEFATAGHKPMAFDRDSLDRHAKVCEWMRDHNCTDYFVAFHVAILGMDATEMFAERNAAQARKSRTVAQALGDLLSSPPPKE